MQSWNGFPQSLSSARSYVGHRYRGLLFFIILPLVITFKQIAIDIYIERLSMTNFFLSLIFNKEYIHAYIDFKMVILLQRDMEIDPSDRLDNLHDDKSEKLGRNFHNIGHHPAMVS